MFLVHRVLRRAPALALWLGSLAFSTVAHAEQPTVQREALVRAALAQHPAAVASRTRAASLEERSASEGSLPHPELMFELWQVPFSQPLAFDEAGMLMVGLRQEFPAPGSRGHSERAAKAEAAAALELGNVALQRVARDVRHAYADYLEASLRTQAHGSHRVLAERLVAAAQAKLAAGAALADVTRAELEVERIEAERAAQAVRADSARARLNALLGRALDAALGAPEDRGPETVNLPRERMLALAKSRRPELAELRAEARKLSAQGDAATSEARYPSFSVAALYFAPVGPMEEHSYGASATMSLPWLWGGASSRVSEKRKAASAATFDIADAERMIDTQVAEAQGAVKSAEARWRALSTRLLPVSKRQLDAALSSYLGGRGSLSDVVEAEQAVIMTELDLIDARAELDHALADAEWAVGGPLPRVRLEVAP